MIELNQWRICIGIWCCRLSHHTSSSGTKNVTIIINKLSTGVVSSTLKNDHYKIVSETFTQEKKPSPMDKIVQLYINALKESKNLTQKKQSLLSSRVMGSRESGYKEHSLLELYCLIAVMVVIKQLILLSGDIEVNPGPETDIKPQLHDLMSMLTEIAPKYTDIGYALKAPMESLGLGPMTGSHKDNLAKTLQWWIDNGDRVGAPVTCQTIIEAIKGPIVENFRVSEKIRIFYEQGKEQSAVANESQPLPTPIDDSGNDDTTTKEVISPTTTKIVLPSDCEEEIEETLDELYSDFIDLKVALKKELKENVSSNEEEFLEIREYLYNFTKSYANLNLMSCQSLDELMESIDPLYDFLDCQIIVALSKKFASKIFQKIKSHSNKAKSVRKYESIKKLQTALKNIYDPYIHDLSNAPSAHIDLNNAWNDLNIIQLEQLIKRFFPKSDQSSLLNRIKITRSSVHIEYFLTEPEHEIMQIIEHCKQNASMMKYLGIYGFEINGVHILHDEHENERYTFQYGLLTAAKDGNNEAVEFLIDLGVDINHVIKKGWTAMRLAIAGHHEQVVQTLISASAPEGMLTPLAVAVTRDDPLELTRYLLDHGAQCNVLVNGTSILDMTSHEETRELLLKHGAMTTQEMAAFKLKNKLEMLKIKIQKSLNDLLSAGSIKYAEVKAEVIDYISQNDKCENIEQLYVLLQSHFSIFNIHPLIVLAMKFLGSEVMIDIDDYLMNLHDFEMNTQLHQMVHITGQYNLEQTSSFIVMVKLNDQWRDRSLADICELKKYYFVSVDHFFTLAVVKEEDSGIACTFKVPLSQQPNVITILTNDEQQQLMKQVEGISGIAVGKKSQNDANESSIVSQHNIGELLMATVYSGNNKTFKLILLNQNVVDVNYIHQIGVTLLMTAAVSNQLAIVETLLIAGTSVNYQKEDGWTALMLASLGGHSDIVQSLLQANASPDIQSENGQTALMIAGLSNHFKVVRCLLEAKANPNIIKKYGRTALMLASKNGHSDIVQSLLQANANPDIQEEDGWTALMIAGLNGHFEVVRCLLEEKANPNIIKKDGRTALMLASKNGHSDIVQSLLQANANPDIQEEDGWTALMIAGLDGHFEVVRCLLEEKANPNIIKKDGWTALMLASKNGHSDIVQSLLQANANPDIQEEDGWTALMTAEQSDHFDVVQYLLQANSDPNLKRKDGWTVLMIASSHGHSEIVQSLLQANASPDIQEEDGLTALMISTLLGHLDIVQHLLQANASPNIQAENGFTALMLACHDGHSDIVQSLLQANASPDIQEEEDGLTALMIAGLSNHFKVVRCLLEAKANPNIIKKDGRTALMLASKNGHSDIVQSLLQANANPDIQEEDGWTALMIASLLGHSNIVQSLLQANANPDVQEKDGWTALMAAGQSDHFDVVQYLLQANSDRNLKRKDGRTALMIASSHGHSGIVQSLLQANASPDIQEEDGLTALMISSLRGHLDIVQLLLQANATPNIQAENGFTALMSASQNGHSDIVQHLLQANADPNIQAENGFTPLIQACLCSNDMLKYMQVDDDEIVQRLTLHRIPMLKQLLDANASPVVTGPSGGELASLTVAAYANNLDAINVLMDTGVEFSNELITQALIAACYVGNPSIINALSHKITDLPNKELLLSCAEGNLAAVISAIYESNVNPDTPLVCGLTPLMVASSCGHIELIDALIQAGADINQLSDYGNSTLDIVGDHQPIEPNQQVISILRENGATHVKTVSKARLLYHSLPNDQPIDAVSFVSLYSNTLGYDAHEPQKMMSPSKRLIEKYSSTQFSHLHVVQPQLKHQTQEMDEDQVLEDAEEHYHDY